MPGLVRHYINGGDKWHLCRITVRQKYEDGEKTHIYTMAAYGKRAPLYDYIEGMQRPTELGERLRQNAVYYVQQGMVLLVRSNIYSRWMDLNDILQELEMRVEDVPKELLEVVRNNLYRGMSHLQRVGHKPVPFAVDIGPD